MATKKNTNYIVPGESNNNSSKKTPMSGEISKRLKGTKYLAKIKSVATRSIGSTRVRSV